jgi:gas vesicle protein
MSNTNIPQIASKGDVLQHALQSLGMNQKGAAYVGAMKDLSCGDLAGYQKNMFEAATGFDPGRLGGALLSSPFGCCSPAANLARLLGPRVPTGKLKARHSYHTPFGTVQTDRRDLSGKGFFGKLKGRALESRLKRDPIFRAKFEAQVGGKYVPDGRNDGKVTVRRFKPKFSGIHGIGARTVLGALGRMQSQIADLIGKLGNKGNDAQGGIQGKEGSYVSKLGPNASFEDLVAAFMKDTMKEQQKEVKDKMAELKKLKSDHDASKKQGGSNIASLLGQPIGDLLQASLPGPISGITSSLVNRMMSSSSSNNTSNSASGSLTDKQKEANSDYQDSRQMMMEELKNMMQKLQQMQQALSNVLNTMHQGAMNSIRNIRA